MIRKTNLIVLTGGGTAGHVMPHIAMLDDYKMKGFELSYIGSKGIEKSLLAPYSIPFYSIQVGKLRRYFSWQNFTDLFRLLVGFCQSLIILFKLRPAMVISKGGFVSVPVAYAAKALGIPLISHESDYTPGLANRLIAPIASKILYSFPETAKFFNRRAELVGIPVRKELSFGQADRARKICGFDLSEHPTILFMGGSLGAQRINDCVAELLGDLVDNYLVIHITGKGKSENLPENISNYKRFEFVQDELADLLALSDLVVSRAGANSLFEFLALRKKMILIPLEQGSRGDQVQNAECFEKLHLARVIRESQLSAQSLGNAIFETLTANNNDDHQKEKTAPGFPSAYLVDARDKMLKIVDEVISENKEDKN